MAMGLWNSRDEMESAISSQISALQKELKDLRKMAEKRGRQSYSEAHSQASDLADELRDVISDAGHRLGRHARGAGENMRNNPGTAAAVGLIVVGLVAAMMVSRSSR
ncbi:MAG: hypothetical protein WBA44_15370 [Mesorhizobium sp.]